MQGGVSRDVKGLYSTDILDKGVCKVAHLSATESISERGGIPSVDVRGTPKPLIRKLLVAIHERVFDETLNVKVLKAYCNVGNNNISCQFKRETGTTIKSYIDTLRMQFALQLLEERKKSVYEVACDIGYANIQTFYRVFRRHFGCTPRGLSANVAGMPVSEQASARGNAPLSAKVTRHRRATLEAAAERILPSENGAGARQANVIGFFDWIIRQSFFETCLPRLTTGLATIDSLAIARWKKPFAECGPAEQDSVLLEIQAIPHASARRFFHTLVNITLAGFLCDPKYGGNHDHAGWKFIGFSSDLITSDNDKF